FSDEMTLDEAAITEGGKIHLMVKKSDNNPALAASAGVSKVATNSLPHVDFFAQLETFLNKHLTNDQTVQVVSEFRKNCLLMMDSMNFDDIERLASSNFTEF
ncbi:unnamed protein product, partial [Meganyctiphanes norvegica]